MIMKTTSVKMIEKRAINRSGEPSMNIGVDI